MNAPTDLDLDTLDITEDGDTITFSDEMGNEVVIDVEDIDDLPVVLLERYESWSFARAEARDEARAEARILYGGLF